MSEYDFLVPITPNLSNQMTAYSINKAVPSLISFTEIDVTNATHDIYFLVSYQKYFGNMFYMIESQCRRESVTFCF